LLVLLGSGLCLQAETAKILKVLPQYLDLEGRHSLSPSLYERDAYQAYLRQHPEKRSALRFDINWKARRLGTAGPALLRLELRSSGTAADKPMVLERTVTPGGIFGHWTSLLLSGEGYTEMGKLLAWRATLWQGDKLLAEQKSFLW
jgi:hypothetical protein